MKSALLLLVGAHGLTAKQPIDPAKVELPVVPQAKNATWAVEQVATNHLFRVGSIVQAVFCWLLVVGVVTCYLLLILVLVLVVWHVSWMFLPSPRSVRTASRSCPPWTTSWTPRPRPCRVSALGPRNWRTRCWRWRRRPFKKNVRRFGLVLSRLKMETSSDNWRGWSWPTHEKHCGAVATKESFVSTVNGHFLEATRDISYCQTMFLGTLGNTWASETPGELRPPGKAKEDFRPEIEGAGGKESAGGEAKCQLGQIHHASEEEEWGPDGSGACTFWNVFRAGGWWSKEPWKSMRIHFCDRSTSGYRKTKPEFLSHTGHAQCRQEVFTASQQLKKAIGVRRTEVKSIQEGHSKPTRMFFLVRNIYLIHLFICYRYINVCFHKEDYNHAFS